MLNDDQARARSALQFFDSNDRDEWVKVGAMLHSTGWGSAKPMWLDWSKNSEKFNERDAETVWKSFKPGGGLNIETLFFRARNRGWNGTADGVLGPLNSSSNGIVKSVSSSSVERPQKIYATISDVRDSVLYRIQHDASFNGCGEFRPTVFPYHDEMGVVLTAAVRVDYFDSSNKPAKTFRMVRAVDGGFSVGGMNGHRPLYRLPQVMNATTIIVCEGEKCCDSLNELFVAAERSDVIATTSVGGAQGPAKSDWSTLEGKQIFVWPDADQAGEKYLDAVAGLVDGTVKVIRPDGMPPKGDAYDWLNGCGPFGDSAMPHEIVEHFEKLLADAVPCEKDVDNAHEVADDESLDFEQFPVDALPEPIRSLVAAAATSIGCDASYIALPILSVLGAAVGASRSLLVKRGWFVPPVTWTAIVGESGTSKSPAMKTVLGPVHDQEKVSIREFEVKWKLHCEALLKYRKELKIWERKANNGEPPLEPDPPSCPRHIVSDVTVEALAPILLRNPRGLLLVRDELAGWLGSFDRYASKSKSDASNWLEMFNGNPILIDRKSSFPPTIYVPHAYVSICGGIQPAILRKALGEENRQNGLAARILMAYPPRKAKQWTEDQIDQETLDGYSFILERLHLLQPNIDELGYPIPAIVRMTAKAKKLYREYYNGHAREQVEMTGDLSMAWSKLEEYPLRLALVVHCVRQAAVPGQVIDNKLDDASLGAAIVIAEWFKRESRRIYATFNELDSEDKDSPGRKSSAEDDVLRWVLSHGGKASARDVCRGCRWLKGQGAEEVLESLVRHEKGKWENVPPQQSGGRPTRMFVVQEGVKPPF